MRKELLEARHRLAELEPAWEMFIDKHNDEEEAREQEQRRKAAVTAQPSERRLRDSKDVSNRDELRLSTGNSPANSTADISHLATPRGADQVLSTALALGSASTLGMFSPVSSGPVPLRPPRVKELDPGIQSGRLQEAHQESTGSSSTTLLRREELIPDSMRKTTLANLDTKALKAFRNIFAHHKNANAKISD